MPVYRITRVKLMKYAVKLGDYYCLSVPKVAENLMRLNGDEGFEVFVDPGKRQIIYQMEKRRERVSK